MNLQKVEIIEAEEVKTLETKIIFHARCSICHNGELFRLSHRDTLEWIKDNEINSFKLEINKVIRKDSVSLIERAIEDLGYTIAHFSDGREAIRISLVV